MTKRGYYSFSILIWLCLLGGCVERKMTIVTEPPGAKVTINGKDVGFTPIYYNFTYYGVYRIVLQKDGFKTRIIDQRVAAPFYEYPPLDLLVENVNPVTIYDKRLLEYELEPLPRPNLDELLQQAGVIRERGKRDIPDPRHPVDPPDDPTPPPAPKEELPPPLAVPAQLSPPTSAPPKP